jgi:hypothetical protein
MQTTEKITEQSPVIRLPQSHHRRVKAWGALRGLTIRQAMCLLIDTLCVGLPDDMADDDVGATTTVSQPGGTR